jgi:heterogeneous nuclear ribonucleoprotein L
MSLTESNFQSGNDNNNSSLNKPIASLGGQIVLSAHNLHPDHFNCDRLFNLLSLYGNVDKCKFLLSKEGSAMLQMSNAKALFDNTVHLNNVNIFGRKIQVHVGKQTVLQPVNNPVNLKDDTCSYKEYMQNRNNRYQSAEAAQKNKPLPPSNVLYWYNAPPGITEEQIMDVFVSAGAILPTKVKIFPKKADKSSTGLVEFDNTSDCVESLIYANHKEITHTSSKFPYIFKMCFSSTPISRDMNSNNKRHNYDTIHNYDNDPNEND